MINMGEVYDLLSRAGIFVDILVVGGWGYSVILFIVFIYKMIYFIFNPK